MWGQSQDAGEALTPHLIFIGLDAGGAGVRETRRPFMQAGEAGKMVSLGSSFFFFSK